MTIDELKRKGKQGTLNLIFSRTTLVILILVLQGFIIFAGVTYVSSFFYLYTGGTIVSIIMYIYLINRDQNANVNKMWLLIIFILPIFGLFLYFYFQLDIGYILFKKRMDEVNNQTKNLIKKDEELINNIKLNDIRLYNLYRYIDKYTYHNVYSNIEIEYFDLGEKMYHSLLKDLKEAKSFIFMSYFNINKGDMWSTILDVLISKAKEGVKVKVMYDGTCTFSRLPYNYNNKLLEYGIEVVVHLPLRPILTTNYNNRDHRKMTIIDGKIAYTGGVNIGDEYINYINPYGHWKDAALKLRGKIVDEFTLMFLRIYNTNRKKMKYDYDVYLKHYDKNIESKGSVIAYGTSPFSYEQTAENIYLDLINNATKKVYITTPYLIIDDNIMQSLILMAKKGIDVRIILPSNSDVKWVHTIGKSFYHRLISAGVKVYEYNPGFIHSKILLVDDITAIVGTINLDYRSLYHHFECGVLMKDHPIIEKIREDLNNILSQCTLIDKDNIYYKTIFHKLFSHVGKFFAPLI